MIIATGCHISEAAQMLVDACKVYDAAQAMFNDISLIADKDSTVEDIIADFNTKMAAVSEAYRNSPEGEKAARESEQRKVNAQQKHDALMRQLPNLNFGDDVAVLDWLCEFQGPSSCIGVVKQQDVVLATFAAHGYYPNANCDMDFHFADRDNFARWIVGQALDELQSKVGAVRGGIHRFTDEWKMWFVDFGMKMKMAAAS